MWSLVGGELGGSMRHSTRRYAVRARCTWRVRGSGEQQTSRSYTLDVATMARYPGMSHVDRPACHIGSAACS